MRTALIVGVCACWCACQDYSILGAADSGDGPIHDGNSCEPDDECVFLPSKSCCPGPPDPCDRGREVGTPEDREEIEKWTDENCANVECPVYSPPECGNCLNLLDYKPSCAQGECVRQETIDCEQLCAAASKNPREACPFFSHPELLTEENLATCGCACKAVDPNAFGDCSSCDNCGTSLGAGFDGRGCFYIQGCDCEPRCADLFDTLDECRSACNRSCGAIEGDIRAFWIENSVCNTDMDCIAAEASYWPLYQHCSCTVYLNRDADHDEWDRLNLEWRLFPNGGSERCGDQGACCDEVPAFPACIDGECGPGEYIDPGWDEHLCESTGGEWDPLSCGHYWCGGRPDCDAIIPGCNCRHGRNFAEDIGCENDVACGVVACAATPELSLPAGRLCEEDAHCADLRGGYCRVFNPGREDELSFCARHADEDTRCDPGTSWQPVWCERTVICMPDGCCQFHHNCADDEVCDVNRPGGLCPEGFCCSEPSGAFTCRKTCTPGSPENCPPTAPRCEVIEILTEDYVEAFYVCLP